MAAAEPTKDTAPNDEAQAIAGLIGHLRDVLECITDADTAGFETGVDKDTVRAAVADLDEWDRAGDLRRICQASGVSRDPPE